MGTQLSAPLLGAASRPRPHCTVQYGRLQMELPGDQVVSLFEPPVSHGQGGRVSSGEQLKETKREPVPPKSPGAEKPQKSNCKAAVAPRSCGQAPQPPWVEGGPLDPQPSLLLSCKAEHQFPQNILPKECRKTSAYKKVAAQHPRKREPGLKGAGPALLDLDAESEVTDSAESSSSWEDLQEEVSEACGAAQVPVRRARPFLQPISWDFEVFEDVWLRPGAKPGQSESLAVPCKVQKLRVLRHGAHVLATAVNSFTRHAFTCGSGGLKVWALGDQAAPDTLLQSPLHWPIQNPNAYLRTCLLAPNGRMLFAGGHNLPGVSVWDLSAPSLYDPDQLPCAGLSCQALDANLSGSLAFAGFSNGTVRIWDLRDRNVIKDLPGRQGEATSIVIKDDAVWTGGLNGCLRCWDLRASRKSQKHLFKSQITSLSHSPWDDWLLVGLASGQHWLQPTLCGQARTAGHKNGAILALKFSPYGQWWVSVGTDKLATIHSMPAGATEFQILEKSCITCCDVSANNRLIITGARDCASVYQVTY